MYTYFHEIMSPRLTTLSTIRTDHVISHELWSSLSWRGTLDHDVHRSDPYYTSFFTFHTREKKKKEGVVGGYETNLSC